MYNYTFNNLRTFHSAAKGVHGTKKFKIPIYNIYSILKNSVINVYNIITKDTKKCKT